MKTKILTLSLTCAITAVAHAGGIPVIDTAAISQSVQNSVKELAEMAKQLEEAQKQLEQMKASVKAMTGVKGFSDILEMGGIDPQITKTFDDLLKGDTSALTESAKKYFDNLPNCKNSKNQSLCEQSALAGVAQVDYAEKLNAQMETELKEIEKLSHRIKQTQDMKSIAEMQADIALKGNKIAVLQQQSADYQRALAGNKEIAEKQAWEKIRKERWEAFQKEEWNIPSTSKNDYSNLFK